MSRAVLDSTTEARLRDLEKKVAALAIRRGVTVTVGDLGSGPPSSPFDGDEWIAHVDSTTDWRFRYRASGGGTYAWKFVGGPPVIVTANGYSSGYNLSAWTPFNGSAWGAGWQGEYIVSGAFSGAGVSSGAATERGGIVVNYGSGYNAPAYQFGTVNPSASYDFSVVVGDTLVTVNTNTTTIALGYWVNGAPSQIYGRVLRIVPRALLAS